jgi:tetratricopeptide (TPR) repeat protein
MARPVKKTPSPAANRPVPRPVDRGEPSDRPADPVWDEVLALRRAGRPARALETLAKLAETDPATAGHAEFARLRGLLHADLAHERELRGDVEGAAAFLQKAIEDAPRFPDLHFRLGVARLRLRDHEGARKEFEAALAIAPSYAAPHVELALLDARQGRLGESLALLRKLGEGHHKEAGEEFRRGLEKLAEADWEGSEDVLRRAFGLGPSPVDERLREVGTLLAENRTDEALALARALVDENPFFPDAHLALALVRRERSEWDDCGEACGRALEINPSFHQARVYLAEALSRRGQWAESDFQLDAVLAAEPEHPLALALARALRRKPRAGRNRPVPH